MTRRQAIAVDSILDSESYSSVCLGMCLIGTDKSNRTVVYRQQQCLEDPLVQGLPIQSSLVTATEE